MSTHRRWSVSCAALVIVTASACNRVVIPPEELASRAVMSTCPPGLPAPSAKEDPPLASLTVRVQAEPALPAGAEVTLRLAGDADKTTLRVNPADATQMSLRKGVYLVTASVPGYTSVEGRAPVTAGCSATLTLMLKKPTASSR